MRRRSLLNPNIYGNYNLKPLPVSSMPHYYLVHCGTLPHEYFEADSSKLPERLFEHATWWWHRLFTWGRFSVEGELGVESLLPFRVRHEDVPHPILTEVSHVAEELTAYEFERSQIAWYRVFDPTDPEAVAYRMVMPHRTGPALARIEVNIETRPRLLGGTGIFLRGVTFLTPLRDARWIVTRRAKAAPYPEGWIVYEERDRPLAEMWNSHVYEVDRRRGTIQSILAPLDYLEKFHEQVRDFYLGWGLWRDLPDPQEEPEEVVLPQQPGPAPGHPGQVPQPGSTPVQPVAMKPPSGRPLGSFIARARESIASMSAPAQAAPAVPTGGVAPARAGGPPPPLPASPPAGAPGPAVAAETAGIPGAVPGAIPGSAPPGAAPFTPESEEDGESRLDKIAKQVDRLDRGGWVTSRVVAFLVVFAVLVLPFLFLESTVSIWTRLGIFSIVLTACEMSRFLARKIFGFRNARIFTLALVGGAERGSDRELPGWKKVMAALAGPAPGIVAGAVGLAYSLSAQSATALEFSFWCLYINGLAALPIRPLDGGRVMRQVLYKRSVIFEVIAAVAGGLLVYLLVRPFAEGQAAIVSGSLFAVLMATLATFRTAAKKLPGLRVAAGGVRKTGMNRDALEQIVGRLDADKPRKFSPRRYALVVTDLFERKFSKAPNLLASLAFLVAQSTMNLVAGTLAVAAAFFVAFGGTGGMLEIARAASEENWGRVDELLPHYLSLENFRVGWDQAAPHLSDPATLARIEEAQAKAREATELAARKLENVSLKRDKKEEDSPANYVPAGFYRVEKSGKKVPVDPRTGEQIPEPQRVVKKEE